MASIQGSDVRKVAVVCEAGMGSSVLLVTQLRDRLKGTEVEVEHAPVSRIPADADVIVTHRSLEATAHKVAPGKVVHLYALFAICEDEMELKLKRDAEALLDKMEKQGVTEVIDPSRKSALARKWRLF